MILTGSRNLDKAVNGLAIERLTDTAVRIPEGGIRQHQPINSTIIWLVLAVP